MAVGRLRRFVVDVNDLAVGEQFWSAVTGLPVAFSAVRPNAPQGQFSGLGAIETGSVLLQLVPERKTALKNRAHLDIGVDDVPGAVAEVIALGGSVPREQFVALRRFLGERYLIDRRTSVGKVEIWRRRD